MTIIMPDELYKLAGIRPSGTVAWGERVLSKKSGVYVISIEDMSDIAFIEPFEEIERKNWRDDQNIIYIGRATVLEMRLRQFYKHIYGKPSPHRGGQAILLLKCIKRITWAEVQDFGDAEDRLINTFQSHTGRMPFGNRARSAKMKANANTPHDSDDNRTPPGTDPSRFAVQSKHEIAPLKLIRTVDMLTEEDRKNNEEHERLLRGM